MKNKLFLVLLLILMTTTVYGELTEISTDIVLLVNNQTITVETEDKDFTFTCGGGSPGTKTISFVRDFTCQNVNELQTIAMELSKNLNHSLLYYDKYLECYASEKVCRNQLMPQNQTQTQTDYIAKYEKALQDYNQCEREKTSLTATRQSSASELSTCEKSLEDAEGAKTTWGIVGLILGGAIGYFIWGRKQAPAQSIAEQQLPKSR